MYLTTSNTRSCAQPSTAGSYNASAFAGTTDDPRFRAQTSPADGTDTLASPPAEEHKDAFNGRTTDPRIPTHSPLATKRHDAVTTMPHDPPVGIHDASASIETPANHGIYADKHDASDSLSTPDAPSLVCCICTQMGPAGTRCSCGGIYAHEHPDAFVTPGARTSTHSVDSFGISDFESDPPPIL